MRAWVIALLLLAVVATAASADEPLTPVERHNATMRFLEGNVELLVQVERHAKGADDRFPFAVRDLYWRPLPGAAAEYDTYAGADGLSGERYRWLLAADPRGAYPMPAVGDTDGWPMISALIQDRERRETRGADGLPEEGPIASLATVLEAFDAGPGLDDETKHRIWYLNHARDQLSTVIHGDDPTDEERQAEDDAASVRLRNAVLAILALVSLIAGTMFAGSRLGAADPQA